MSEEDTLLRLTGMGLETKGGAVECCDEASVVGI